MKPDPGGFFDAAHEVFLSAKSLAQDYSIGELALRFQIADGEMPARLSRAFAHLKLPAQKDVDLTIRAWDGRETGTKMISPPWSESDYGPRGEIHGFNTDRFRTAFDHGTDSLSMIDLERRIALFWTRDARQLPTYETGAPFRAIFSWWTEARDLVFAHAAAIGNEQGAALLAGAGGSGKSTTALVCLQAGWRYLADDYCLLQTGESPRVFSLYSSAKLGQNPLPGFPRFEMPAGKQTEMDGEKEIFFLNEICPEQLSRSIECRTLFLPRISLGRDTSVESASPGDALRALAPSSIFQVSGAGAIAFQCLSNFVRTIPVRWLNLGTDLTQIPKCLGDSLAEV